MKKLLLVTTFLLFLASSSFGQDSTWDARYDLTICTMTRNADAVLLINDSIGNMFTGILLVDDLERSVFGWYVQKVSQGGPYIYNTEGMVFYVKLVEGFQYQQLFKGLYNYDKTIISGEYTYWGNEFIFYGTRADTATSLKSHTATPGLRVYPNPVDDYLTLDSENKNNERIDIYSLSGKMVLSSRFMDRIRVSTLHTGTYILVLTDKLGRSEKIKFIKN